MWAVKHSAGFSTSRPQFAIVKNKMGESKTILVLSCGGALFSAGKRPSSRFRTNSRCQELPFSCPLQLLFPSQKQELLTILRNYFLKSDFSLHMYQDSLFYRTVCFRNSMVLDTAVHFKFSSIYLHVYQFIFCCQNFIDQHFAI